MKKLDKITHDMAKHKRAEEALQQSQQMLQLVLDTIPVSVFWKDRNSVYLGCNRMNALKIGLNSPEQIVGKNDFDLCWAKKAELYRSDDQYVIQTGNPKLNYEESETISDGREIWVRSSKVPLRDTNNNIIGVLGIAENITERKKAEDTLANERNLLRSLVDALPDYIYVKDVNSRFVFVNASAAVHLGVKSPEELLGKTDLDFFPKKTAQRFLKEEHEIIRSRKAIFDREQYSKRKQCGKIEDVCTVTKVPWRDDKDNIIGIIGINHDIRERKLAEKKLAGYRDRLRAMSSKLLLAEEHQRHQIAAKLHDSIGQDMALSMLKLDTLKKSISSKDIVAELDKVKKTIEKTIQDTRTLSFDLSSPTLYRFGFVRAIEQWISEQVQGKHGIKAVFVENGKVGPLDEDVSIVLFQTAREALVNVIKHARAKSVKISIRPTDGKIETIIEDDGVGFDTSEIDSFIHKNSGFGLFSIRERLNYLGGDIKIESRPGHGTRITLIAPLQTEETRGKQL